MARARTDPLDNTEETGASRNQRDGRPLHAPSFRIAPIIRMYIRETLPTLLDSHDVDEQVPTSLPATPAARHF